MNNKKKIAIILAALLAIMLLGSNKPQIVKIVRVQDAEITRSQDSRVGAGDMDINVYNADTGKIQPMKLEDYIYHVVAGEMPASYDEEALKAQAVAARTYLIRKQPNGCSAKEGADICTNSEHCQAFSSDEKLKENWGENYDKYSEKLRKAVNETAGEILTYEGEAIEAFYHASSGGQTEDVSNVYSESQPYLKSVSSSGDEDERTVTFTSEKFAAMLSAAYPGSGITKSNFTDVTILSRYDSERVENVRVGKTTITGKQFRKALDLRSAIFWLEFSSDSVKITTHGYGHGVGMSQMGANSLAEEGEDYVEILTHYYEGAEITRIQSLK